jgi:hypothetical protein
VKKDGYAAQSFVLDGTEPKLSVRLEREKATKTKGKATSPAQRTTTVAMAARPAAAAPSKVRAPSSEGIVNPWAR